MMLVLLKRAAWLMLCMSTSILAMAETTHDHHQMHMMHDMPGMSAAEHQAMTSSANAPQKKPAVKKTKSPAASKTETPVKYPAPSAAEISAAFPPLSSMTHDHAKPLYYGLVELTEFEKNIGPAAGVTWGVEASYGGDFQRIALQLEGDRDDAEHSQERFFANYRNAIRPWWTFTAGIRHDRLKDITQESRSYAGIGLQGTTPFFVEVGASLWFSDAGKNALLLDAHSDVRITQKLLLRPNIELNAYRENDAALQHGRGLSDGNLGLRLHYEVRREFAPYVGAEWSSTWGQTADWQSAQGNDRNDSRVFAGVSAWF